MEINRREIDLERYWDGEIPYSGREHDKLRVINLGNKIKNALLEETIKKLENLNPVYKSIDHTYLKVKIGTMIYRKSIMFTSIEANKILDKYERLLDEFSVDLEYLMKKLPITDVYSAIEESIHSLYELDLYDNETVDLEFFNTYHDYFGHYVIEMLSGEKYQKLYRSLPNRLQDDQVLNSNYLFSKIGSALFKKYLSMKYSREQIYYALVEDYTGFLTGKKSLHSISEGEVHLDVPLTSDEAQIAKEYQAQEIAISYYEPYLFFRYDSNIAVDSYLSRYYPQHSLIGKLENLARIPLGRSTVDQDSIYIRGEALQQSFTNCMK